MKELWSFNYAFYGVYYSFEWTWWLFLGLDTVVLFICEYMV